MQRGFLGRLPSVLAARERPLSGTEVCKRDGMVRLPLSPLILEYSFYDVDRLTSSISIASMPTADGTIFIDATRRILKIDTALLSYASNATNGSPPNADGTSIASATLATLRRFPFNVTHSSSVGRWPLRDNVSFVYSIRTFRPRNCSINS